MGAVKLFTYQPTTHQRRIISALEFAESDRTHFYDDCDEKACFQLLSSCLLFFRSSFEDINLLKKLTTNSLTVKLVEFSVS